MTVKGIFRLLPLLVTLMCGSLVSAQSDNVAYRDSHVRFTVIADGVVRMEWTPDGKFEDAASFVAVQRSYPKVSYKVKDSSGKVTITTSRFRLVYTKGKGQLSKENLRIESVQGLWADRKRTFVWTPGMKDDKNLKGTYRTLDGYDGDTHVSDGKMPLEDGLLSRNGWTFIDDSDSYVFDNSDWPWVSHRRNEGKTQDWYLMVYGNDYKRALNDFTLFAGKVPLPPRYVFGYWWSRYWAYSDNELRSLVAAMKEYDVPMDVMVIDMDWHYTEPGKGGWTGYTWNRRLFPDPKGFLSWVKVQELETTLNLHPADGIHPYEQHYPEMAQWMGVDASSGEVIAWNASDKRFMQGWYDKILRPIENDGINFWWLDWQQWNNDKDFPRLSNTWWINYTTFTDMERHHPTRPMLYHRWGGLGNHRYQIGFSGDAIISWKSLEFQPYFNSTASNVLYGYWSHDIGGHMGAHSIDPEMYVRWMQFGLYSPVLRTHSTKDAGLNKEPWVFGYRHTKILHDIVHDRYRLAPYIYTMARKTYDEALSLCRPMYYDYPECEEAYSMRNEYMFGDNILVSPITASADHGVSLQRVWLPAGNDWYEVSTGTLLKGGQTIERRFLIDEYPVYVKAGSILPEYGRVKNLKHCDEPITVTVYPGGSDSRFAMYEDNGNDQLYPTDFAITELETAMCGDTLSVRIGARKGSYKDMPAHRKFSLRLVASDCPVKIVANGRDIPFTYDGNTLSVLADIPFTDCAMSKDIKVIYPKERTDVADGLIGKFRYIQQLCIRLKQATPGINFDERLGTMESTGVALTYSPRSVAELVALFEGNYANLREVLEANGLEDDVLEEALHLAK